MVRKRVKLSKHGRDYYDDSCLDLLHNDPTAGSTAATESTHADVNGTAKSGNDVCFGKTLVKRVKSVTDQFHSN